MWSWEKTLRSLFSNKAVADSKHDFYYQLWFVMRKRAKGSSEISLTNMYPQNTAITHSVFTIDSI